MTVGGGELHTRLRIARECSGLTQAELAARAGFAVNTLKQYESGRIKPGADALAGYARSGINVTYLLLGEGSPLLARQGDYGTHQVTTALLVGEGRRRARWEVPLAQAAEAMREIVVGIDRSAEELGFTLGDSKKAELAQVLFEEFVEGGAMPRPTTIVRFLKAAS